MKKWIVLVLLLGAAGYGFVRWREWQAKQPQAAAGRPTTAPVIQTNIVFGVSAAGEISPAEQVSVRPEINGKIEKLPVDLGDRVKKGDLLFGLDDKELRTQYASTMTTVERSTLELQQAERNYKRAVELRAEKLISEELYENSKTQYELAKNSLDRSRKDLSILEERLSKTEVRAPFDCTVLTRPVSIGQAVSGSGGFNSGTEVLTIADLNAMIINAHVNQADVPRLRVEQEVEVTVEAVAGLKVKGVVERIAPQATIKNNIKGFSVRILLKEVGQGVRPGMTANIKIPVAAADNVLAVPLASVFTEMNPDTQQRERFVYVQKPDGFEKRIVEVGVSDYFYAEIQKGLSPGDVVSLETPKEEREKLAKSLAAGGEAAVTRATNAPTSRPAATPATTGTKAAAPAGGTRASSGAAGR